LSEQGVGAGEFAQDRHHGFGVGVRRATQCCFGGGAVRDGFDHLARRPQSVAGFGAGEQQVGALRRRVRLAHHVQAVRDQGVFEFEQLAG
jgi:hypothetical protein